MRRTASVGAGMYWIHKPDTHLVIDTDQAPERVQERIGADLDRVRSIIWSPAFGARSPFVGVLDLPSIQMRVRHGYSNGFTRLMYGTIDSVGSGSRLILSFRSIWWIELLVRMVEVVFVAPLLAYALALLIYAQRGGGIDWTAEMAVSVLAVFPLVFLIGIEWFARWLGDRDEAQMREALQAWFPS